MPGTKQDSSWWDVVKALAGFVVSGHSEDELLGVDVKAKLLDFGFQEAEITKAYEWLDKVTLSGSLSESLSMLQPQGTGTRIANPIESIFLSEKLWNTLQVCRMKGLISDELMERFLEGVRTVDARDWDDEDVSGLMVELIGMVIPGLSEQQYLALVEGNSTDFYC